MDGQRSRAALNCSTRRLHEDPCEDDGSITGDRSVLQRRWNDGAKRSGKERRFAKPAGLDQFQPQPDGFLLLSQKGIEEDFAQDLTPAEKARLVAAQPKTAGSIFEAKPSAAAWRSKPAWYVVASNDRMIDPEQERGFQPGARGA